MQNKEVFAHKEPLVIPTYEPGAPEELPIFYPLRNYQYTRGDIYPLQAVEEISNEKTDHTYQAIRLENEYVRTTVLPELGGRVWEGYAKPSDYNFVYKNNVIKPALVGLCGPWISGGIEFNWPQHHRPTTYMPVDARLVDNEDGSQTAWMGEIEPKDGTKGMVGITVEPGRSYIRADARLYNRTPDVKNFHWWANLAVHVNDSYRLIFPPDIDYVAYHYKADVSPFPVVKGSFALADFGEGKDISQYRNVAPAASFFIFNSRYNFMAGYDDEKQCGTVHVADHYVSPGKKFFTWGTEEFADAWYNNLTDHDGPYIEIMTGCYTDNQPDFTWIQPYETKTFQEYWYPITRLPYLKNATVDAAVSLGIEGNSVCLAFNTTSRRSGARYVLTENGSTIAQAQIDIAPDQPYSTDVPLDHKPDMAALQVILFSKENQELVEYHLAPMYFDDREAPKNHAIAPKLADIQTQEELFLHGLHIEQYRNAVFNEADYYMEALRRDEGDSRCNLAMGRLEMRRGRFTDAKAYILRAIETITSRNPNPYDAEAYYLLGRVQRSLENGEAALDAYQKAAWSYAQFSGAMHESAELEAQQGNIQRAVVYAEKALLNNHFSLKTRFLLSSLYRRCGRNAQAIALCEETQSVDPLDYGSLFELYLHTANEDYLTTLKALLCGRGKALVPLAMDYLQFGCNENALQVCALLDDTSIYRHYVAAMALHRMNRIEEACTAWSKAEACGVADANPTDFSFMPLLMAPFIVGERCAKACYLLGNLCYARGTVPEAQRWWNIAEKQGMQSAVLHRNRALAFFEHEQDRFAAKKEMETAFHLAPENPRLLLELVLLYKALCISPEERLALLESHAVLLPQRPALYLEYLSMLNLCGKTDMALRCLQTYSFRTYEGGEGLLPRQHTLAYVLSGYHAEKKGNWEQALALYQQAEHYPPNYHEGHRFSDREGALKYRMANTLKMLGRVTEADEVYKACTAYPTGLDETGVYKALAYRRLGDWHAAAAVLREMVGQAQQTLGGDCKFGYFELFPVGMPFNEDMETITQIRCLLALTYAYMALGNETESESARDALSRFTVDTPWINILCDDLQREKWQ